MRILPTQCVCGSVGLSQQKAIIFFSILFYLIIAMDAVDWELNF